MAGPSMKRKMSPAPRWTGHMLATLYDVNMEWNDCPVAHAKSFINAHVREVHVISGWTILVKDFGSLAPKTKVARVVQIIVMACSGVVMIETALERNAYMDASALGSKLYIKLICNQLCSPLSLHSLKLINTRVQ